MGAFDDLVPQAAPSGGGSGAGAFDDLIPAQSQQQTAAGAHKETFMEALGTTWPAQLAKTIGNIFTTSRDVYQGKVDPKSDQAINAMADAAMTFSPGSAANGSGAMIAREAGVGKPALPLEAGAARQQAAQGVISELPWVPPASFDTSGIKLSKGQASKDFTQQQFENIASRGGYGEDAQKTIAPFFDQQRMDLGSAKDRMGAFLGGGNRVENPFQAGEQIAGRAQDIYGRAQQQELDALSAPSQQLAATRGAVDAPAAGEVVSAGVRNAAQQAKQGYQSLYKEAESLPGQFRAGAFEGIGQRIKSDLTSGNNPVIIDDVTTPAASRAIQDIDNGIGQLRVQNRADPSGPPTAVPAVPGTPPVRTPVVGPNGQVIRYEMTPAAPEIPGDGMKIIGINLPGIGQARSRLVAFYKNTQPGTADRRAIGAVMHAFDARVESAMADGLFTGDPRAVEAWKEARASYSQYVKTFRPQGAGDDVGNAMRSIIERNAQPNEVANYMFGASAAGETGLSVRLADRLEQVLGKGSDEWKAIQQGFISRAIGKKTDPAEMAENLARATEGPGRFLAGKILSPEQRQAISNFRDGVNKARAAREAIPDWVNQIAAGNFEPQRVIDDLLGRASVGGKTSSTQFAMGIRSYFGVASPEWAAIRQGAFQKLTEKPKGVTDFGAEAVAQRIQTFLNGDGKALANVIYTPEQRQAMSQLADVFRDTVPIKGAAPNSDSAPAIGSMFSKLKSNSRSILAAIGAVADGGITGGMAGYGLASAVEKGEAAWKNAKDVARARAATKGVPTPGTSPYQPGFVARRAPLPLGENELKRRLERNSTQRP